MSSSSEVPSQDGNKEEDTEIWKSKYSTLAETTQKLQNELDNAKSEIEVASCIRESMLELERQKMSCDEELATMQQLLNESHDEASITRTRYEHELAKTQAIVGQLENENHELKIQMKLGSNAGVGHHHHHQGGAAGQGLGDSFVDKETLLGGAAVLSDATKSFARRVKSNLQTAVIGPGPKEMDEGMKKAYEDTELLKAIVVPLEEQIGALKDKLRETDGILREHEARQSASLLGVEALAQWLQGKSIEEAMTALLQKSEDPSLTQEKEAAQKDASTSIYLSLLSARYSLLNSELATVRKEHGEVVALLDKERSCNNALRQDSVVASSDMVRTQREHLAEIRKIQAVLTEEQKAEIMREDSPPPPRPSCSSNDEATAKEGGGALSSSAESSPGHTCSSNDSSSGLQQHAKDGSNSSTAALSCNAAPTRIVSNVEWEEMQKELSKVRALLGVGAGDSVVGSDQYRQLQAELIELKKQKAVLVKAEEKMKAQLKEESVYRKEVEEKWNERAEQHKTETEGLHKKTQELEGLLEQLRISYSTVYEATRKDLQSLTADREKIVRELKRLQDEVDILTGKHLVKSEEMQNEVINLPEKTEDMHLLLLKYREDLITEKIARERLEERTRSEVQFLKTQLSGEQQAKETIEDQFTSEIDALRDKLQRCASYKKELETEQKRRKEMEGTDQKSRAALSKLQSNLAEVKQEKQKLEAQIFEMKNRITNLQQELDNSVAVQTDFVRLSQSLQMELEKIRQAEKEVISSFYTHPDATDLLRDRVNFFPELEVLLVTGDFSNNIESTAHFTVSGALATRR